MKTLTSFFLTSIFSISAMVGVASAADPSPGTQSTANEPAKPEKETTKAVGECYPLATCPITGKKLGTMGDPIVKTYDGREVRFCCNGCPSKFEKDLAKSFAALDPKIVADQAPLYPLNTSVVSGKKLSEKPIDWVYNNRLIRLADESEKAVFQKDPAKFAAALNKAVIEAQGKDYPLTQCPVSNDNLGEMGKTNDIMIAGRLIRLCCDSCEDDVKKNPAKFIVMIDEARKSKASK